MSGHERDGEARFTRRAREVFDASVTDLDAATRARLVRARAAALERRNAAPLLALLGRRRWLAPAGALAAAALVAIVVARGPLPERTPVDVIALADTDLEMLLGDDELEMLEELEFYAWLEAHPELARPAPADDGVG